MHRTDLPSRKRGLELLIAHCAVLDVDRRRPSALERVEAEVGVELAALLVAALSDERRRRGGYRIRSAERGERRGRRISSCP